MCKWKIYFSPYDFHLNWLADTYCNHHNERIGFAHLFGKYHILYNGTVLCFHHQITYIQGKSTENIKDKVVRAPNLAFYFQICKHNLNTELILLPCRTTTRMIHNFAEASASCHILSKRCWLHHHVLGYDLPVHRDRTCTHTLCCNTESVIW